MGCGGQHKIDGLCIQVVQMSDLSRLKGYCLRLVETRIFGSVLSEYDMDCFKCTPTHRMFCLF